MEYFGIPSLLVLMPAYASAVPVSNVTLASPMVEPAWGPEPKGRGTFSIIFSSLITLTMCVWTCLHLNVVPNATTCQRVFHKLKFVVTGIFAPEAVLLMAFWQFEQAMHMRQHWSQETGIQFGEEGSEISMEEAFFVCMGGFTTGSPIGGNYFQNTLTPEGFVALTREGIIPKSTMNRRQILDKGKADVFAKLLVCVQAFWMVIQVVARKTSGLPVTLLEIHVLVHVLCTVIMYGFWFSKPLDITEPIPAIRDPRLASLITVMYAKGRLDCELLTATEPNGNTAAIDPKPSTHTAFQGLSRKTDKECDLAPLSESISKIYFIPHVGSAVRIPGGILCPKRYCRILGEHEFLQTLDTKHEAVIGPGESLIIGDQISITCETCDHPIEPLQLNIFDIATLSSAAEELHNGGPIKRVTGDKIVDHRVSNETDNDQTSYNSLVGIFMIFLLPLIYSGCHAASWNTHFPTPLERWIWRISSILVGAIPALSVFFTAFFAILSLHLKDMREDNALLDRVIKVMIESPLDWLNKFIETTISRLGRIAEWYFITVLSIGAFITIGLPAIALCLSRVFLVVESFLSLRSLPIGSFATAPWDDYWPHL